MFLWNILGESFFKVTPVYNSRGLPSGGLQKLLPSDAYGSGSRPHPGTAGLQATAYAVAPPCGRVSPAERVTAVMPGAVSLRPALTPGLKRESATSFRLTIGTGC